MSRLTAFIAKYEGIGQDGICNASCRACGKRWTAIHALSHDRERLECPWCGAEDSAPSVPVEATCEPVACEPGQDLSLN